MIQLTNPLITPPFGEQASQPDVLVYAKGPNFVFGREYIKNTCGETVWQNVLDHMPESAREVWKQKLITVGSYPFIAFKQMLHSLATVLEDVSQQQTAQMYEYIADRSLNSLYKIFFSFTKPSFVISNYPKLWQRFFTCGEVNVPVATKEFAMVEFLLPEIFLDWLPPACYGYSKKAVEMAGGTQMEMHLNDKIHEQDNSWHFIYELQWKE
ncbi:hypothetical protein JW948_15770 [bacterium]|nr:hypothetical protein [bacterium]